MAAAVAFEFCATATRNVAGWPETQPPAAIATTTPPWDELDLDTRLGLIARAWVLSAPSLSLVRALDTFGERNILWLQLHRQLRDAGELVGLQRNVSLALTLRMSASRVGGGKHRN